MTISASRESCLNSGYPGYPCSSGHQGLGIDITLEGNVFF